MARYLMAALVLLVANSALFLPSLACPYCPTPTVTPPPPPPPTPPPPAPCPPPPVPKVSPPSPKVSPPAPKVSPPSPKVSPPAPKVSPPSPKAPPSAGACPIDTLKLDACVDLLSGLVHAVIGQSVKSKCCPVIEGLADLDAALCLCTTIKAKALDVKVLLPIAIELLIDCGKHVPSNYKCPA